ncbi:MAG: hypothetical protein WCI71_15745 [Bacteroidota bacterium]
MPTNKIYSILPDQRCSPPCWQGGVGGGYITGTEGPGVGTMKGVHWAWTYSLYLGIMLIIWIMVEMVYIDYDILQTIYGLLGVIIVIVALLPANMRYFGWQSIL